MKVTEKWVCNVCFRPCIKEIKFESDTKDGGGYDRLDPPEINRCIVWGGRRGAKFERVK